MSRRLANETVLQEADRLVATDRHQTYGHPLDDYTRTTAAFHALTGHALTAEEGILFMICVKLSREVHCPKRDNRVDGPGYFKCLDLAIAERARRAQTSARPRYCTKSKLRKKKEKS